MELNNSLKEVWSKEYIIDKKSRIGWSMDEYHFHEHYEIYLTLTDDVKLYIDGRLYQMKRGSLALFSNVDMHKVVVPKDICYERYIFHFKPEFIDGFSLPGIDLLECFLNRPLDSCPVIQLDEQQLIKLLPLFDKVIDMYQNPSFGENLYNKILLVELLLNIIPLYRVRNDFPVLDSKSYRRIQPVLSYIHENLNLPLSIERIADVFYFSSSHLEYIFKKATGSSINKYIVYRRIIKARELLKEGLSVSSVSELVGFNNLSHFIRTFKKIVGVSPKQYAKQNSR